MNSMSFLLVLLGITTTQAMPLVKFVAGKPALADSVNVNFSKIDSVLTKIQIDHATYTSTEMQKSLSRKFAVQLPSDTSSIFLDPYGLNFQGSQAGYYLGYDWSGSFGLGYWKSSRSGMPFTPALVISNGTGISLLDKTFFLKPVILKDPSISLPNVFDSSYSLATIDELATFSKLTKGLPDYPTSAEIQSNGLDVAKTNILLLKKVEELTLHVIQLNARIKALESK